MSLTLAGFTIALFLISAGLIFVGRKRVKSYGGTLGVATKYFQMLAIIGKLSCNWPREVKEGISRITAVFTLKPGVVAPECGVGVISYDLTYSFVMMLPVLFLAIFAAIAALVGLAKGCRLSAAFKNRLIHAYLSLLLLGFLSLASMAFEPFGCVAEADGSYSLASDPSYTCFSAWWYRRLFLYSVSLITVIVVFPGFVAVTLRRYKEFLQDPHFAERYGCLYGSFEKHLTWWEIVILGEKVAVAAISTLLPGAVFEQIICFQFLFTGTLSLYQSRSPYVLHRDNVLHAALRWSMIVVLMAGLIFRVNILQGSRSLVAMTVLTLAFISLSTMYIVWNLVTHAFRVRRQTNQLPKKEAGFIKRLFCVSGCTRINEWLASDPTWCPPFFALLEKVMDEPVYVEDNAPADLVVAAYTLGFLNDGVVSHVRQWLLRPEATARDVSLFKACFTALGQFHADTLERLPPAHLTRRRLAMTSWAATAPETALRLRASLFGPMLTGEDLLTPKTLHHLRSLYLAVSKPRVILSRAMEEDSAGADPPSHQVIIELGSVGSSITGQHSHPSEKGTTGSEMIEVSE